MPKFTCKIDNLEIKSTKSEDSDKQTRVVSGRAVVYDTFADRGWFKEKIDKSIFEDIKDVVAIWNHNDDLVLANTASGTLTLENKDDGLYFEFSLPDSPLGDNCYTSIERGDVPHMSFGVNVTGDEWKEEMDKTPERTITKGELVEISPTAFPVFKETSVEAKSSYEKYKSTKHQEPEPEPKPPEDPDDNTDLEIEIRKRKFLK